MTTTSPPHTGLPEDRDEGWADDDSGTRRRGGRTPAGRQGDRELGRAWWRPSQQPRENRPPLRERLVPNFPPESRWIAWGLPFIIMGFGGILRFWQLNKPNAVVFDETYYAKDAWTVIHFGHERAWLSDPKTGMAPDDVKIIANPHIWRTLLDGNQPGYAVHPPVGKWMIGLGEWLFGFNPFGWRFVAAICGTLAILMIARIARRLFRSTLIGCIAALLMTMDGMEFVMSRIALLDIFVMFWTLAAFGCLLIDRDQMRRSLADWRESLPSTALPDESRGPKLGWRPWRIAAVVCLGLDMGTKWSGMWIAVIFVTMALLWDHAAYRAAGIRRHITTFWRRSAWQWTLSTLLIGATYMATWAGWFITKDGYDRQYAAQPGVTSWPLVPPWLRSWWQYHWDTLKFHQNLDTPHAYMSNPWSWLIQGRPTDYYYEGVKQGTAGCKATDCSQQVLALGTPTLWWLSTIALIWCIWRWIGHRDWRAGAILGGMLAAWAFWLHYEHRTIFTFYAIAFEPFMILAAAYLLGTLLGREDAPAARRRMGAIAAGSLVIIVIWTFMYFYPIYTGSTITYNQWQDRMWWPSWV